MRFRPAQQTSGSGDRSGSSGITRRDLAVGGLCATGVIVLFVSGAYDQSGYDRSGYAPGWVVGTGLVAALGATLCRTLPLPAVLIAIACFGVEQLIGPSLATTLILSQVLYDASVHGPRWLPRPLLSIGAMVTIAVMLLEVVVDRNSGAAQVGVLLALVFIVPVWSGLLVRKHRDEATLERERAEKIALLAEIEVHRTITDERTRMARELHDVVASHLSVVAIHSTGALALPPERTGPVREALIVIRESAVQGLVEMREAIKLLRVGQAPLDAMTSRLDGLPELVARIEQAGMPVHLKITGQRQPLASVVEIAAYRIVQECLTNALKHGSDAVTVTVRHCTGRLLLEVSNPIRTPTAAPTPSAVVPGSGNGLVGMRERATLLGGRFQAGRDNGVFVVNVELPSGESA